MTHLRSRKKTFHNGLIFLFMAAAVLALITACRASSPEEGASATETSGGEMPDMGHDEEMDGMDMGQSAGDAHDAAARQLVPNDGAEVRITAPADEASFQSNDTVPVMIETTNFTIGEDGNHWHIYLDGVPTMVMGGNTYVLQNLPAGRHEIEVFLSNGNHEDLEQGDIVTITVED